MKDPKGLLKREIARILPRHPNIAVDPRLIERLIEKDNLVDLLALPPLSEIATNAVIIPVTRDERMIVIGAPDFIRVAVLAAAGHGCPYHEINYLWQFVDNNINEYKTHGHDVRTIAKLWAIEHAINVHQVEQFKAFNSVLLNRTSHDGTKQAVRREGDRAAERAAREAAGEELTTHDANGDHERVILFDPLEKRALEVIATAFRAIYAQKDLSAAIGPHRVIVKPAPTSTHDVASLARRILDAP